MAVFLVYRKPPARLVVPEKLTGEEEIKTPFAIIGEAVWQLHPEKQKEVIEDVK